MDTNRILKHMTAAGIKPDICEILKPVLEDLEKNGRDPYMLGVDLVHMAGSIVRVALPPEEFYHFGKFLRGAADTDMRAALSLKSIHQDTAND